MRSIVRVGIASAAATGMLAAGGLTTPASAVGPINVGNLVNVNISNNDVLNDVSVDVVVPINAAANICGLTVGVLATDLETGPVECDARGNQAFTITDVAE